MQLLRTLAPVTALALSMAGRAAADPTMGIEWEYGGKTGVIAIDRVEPGNPDATDASSFDHLLLFDPQSATAQRLICVDPTGDDADPLVSFTYDMGLPSTGFTDRTLEVVTGPLAYNAKDWAKVLKYTELFFDSLRATCTPKRYTAVGMVGNEEHRETGKLCYAPAATVIDKMRELAKIRGGLDLAIEGQAKCNKASLGDAHEAGFYLTYDTHDRKVPLDTAFYESATPQVNLAISLDDVADKDLSFLFTPGTENIALQSYQRARAALGALPPRLRAFFVLYAYTLNAGTMNRIRSAGELDDEADRKNRFDLYLKTRLGEVYKAAIDQVGASVASTQPYVISTDPGQMAKINSDLCYLKFTSTDAGDPVGQPLCLTYTVRKIGKTVVDEQSGKVIADWNKILVANVDGKGNPLEVAKPVPLKNDRVVVEIRRATQPINAAAHLTYTWEGLRLVDEPGLQKILSVLR